MLKLLKNTIDELKMKIDHLEQLIKEIRDYIVLQRRQLRRYKVISDSGTFEVMAVGWQLDQWSQHANFYDRDDNVVLSIKSETVQGVCIIDDSKE